MKKRFINLICWIMFRRPKRTVFLRLKVVVLSFLDLLKAPITQQWSKRAIWRQVLFQRWFRSDESVSLVFQRTLRVCITYRCNLECHYCYIKGIENSFLRDMTPEDFLSLVLWAKDRGWNHIRFLGGEPTIHPYFTKMLEACYSNEMFVTLATNNLFPSRSLPILDNRWVDSLTINYNASQRLNNERLAVFKENLRQLYKQKIPFEFSYTIDHQNDNLREIFEDTKLYRPMSIRVSLAIPGLSKQTSISELTSNFKSISRKVFEFQENCIKLNIPFYIYRPLMPCMFSSQEWKNLKGTFPFICFIRCPLGAMGNYSTTIVVNPDLSIFPCIAVFIKGPNIFTFKNREEISSFYREKIKQMLSEPSMELCRTCASHKKFISNLERGINSDLKSSFSDGLCQGGCLNFKESAQSLCQLE